MAAQVEQQRLEMVGAVGLDQHDDATGRKTVTVVSTSQFGAKFPEVQAADQGVVDAAVCAMLGRPIPAS